MTCNSSKKQGKHIAEVEGFVMILKGINRGSSVGEVNVGKNQRREIKEHN
jgi:predicted RNA-binding protein with TRAM domain